MGAAALVLAAGCSSGPRTDGPIETTGGHGWAVPGIAVGDTFTDGFETIKFEGDPVTIDDVRSLGGEEGLRQIGVHLAGDDRRDAAIQYDPSFPPKAPGFGTLLPAIGETIQPRPGAGFDSWELVIGYEVTAPGRWQRDEVEVVYSTGGQQYVVRFPAELVVCTEDVGRCEPSG